MKNNIIISIIIATVALCAAGCTDKNAKAQALLVEAISYSTGEAPTLAAQDAALKLAASKGIKVTDQVPTRDVVACAGRILCDRILTDYPQTPAAVKAAELRSQIEHRILVWGNERIRRAFDTND